MLDVHNVLGMNAHGNDSHLGVSIVHARTVGHNVDGASVHISSDTDHENGSIWPGTSSNVAFISYYVYLSSIL